MSERKYYITEYSDEVVPCDCTLDGWAQWLSKPDPEWGRDEAAVPGESFAASVTRFEDDIIATHDGDGWTLSRDPGDADFIAVRFAAGLGWPPEAIVYPEGDETMADALRLWLEDNGDATDSPENVAVGYNEPDVVLTYRTIGGNPSLEVATQQ